MVLAIAVFVLTQQILIPFLGGTPYLYASNFLQDPGYLVQGLFSLSTLAYLIKIFLPLGFLSWASPPELMLCLPILFQNLLSKNPSMHSIFHQYTTGLTPFVFFSAMQGARKLSAVGWKWFGMQRIAMTVLLCSVAMAGASEYHVWWQYRQQRPAELRELLAALDKIPKEASVRVSQTLAPWVAGRLWVHIYENAHPREGGSARARNSDYVVLNLRDLKDGTDTELRDLFSRGYRTTLSLKEFLILKAPTAL